MIVVDSSSIISLAVNCLSHVLNKFDAKFFITPMVYEEVISRPSGSRRFALESMRIQLLIKSGALVVQKPKGDLTNRVLDAANRIYEIKGRELKIIHPAEAEAIALADEIGAEAFLIDERTTRLLMEDPYELKELLSHRNKADVRVDEGQLRRLRGILPDVPVIRSAELVAVAYEKGHLTRMHGVEDKSVLEAALSALKFSGCSITWDEIGEYQRVVI
jgi:predicted nucleic acid-binding protein